MIKNVVLVLVSAGLLALLSVGYFALIDDPRDDETKTQKSQPLPPQTESGAGESFQYAGFAELPPGGEVQFRVYDAKTGRATDFVKFADWKKVPGGKNEIEVTSPELAMVLPSGMTATISAASGRISADRVEKTHAKPKAGRLEGRAKIVFDRNSSPDRGSADDRPEDLITVEMDALEFDLDHGTLRTDSPVHVTSFDFEIHGTGVDLEWNQGENKLERLIIPRGDRFVLFTRVGGGEEAAASQPTEPAPQRDTTKRKTRGPITYLCTLDGGVSAAQYQDDSKIGGLDAEEIRVTLDTGNKDDQFFGARRKRSREPSDHKNRLEVHWGGQMSLGPVVASGKPTERQRRRFEALGETITVLRGDTTITCGRIEYQDDSQQAWIYPAPSGRVELTTENRIRASAGSVYLDNARGVIKLIDRVEMRSLKTGPQTQSIHASQWGELRMAKHAGDSHELDSGQLFATGQLESASFSGDVAVELGERRRLTAAQLDLRFRPTVVDQTDAATSDANSSPAISEPRGLAATSGLLVEQATASSGVKLATPDESVTCDRLTIDFATEGPGRGTEPTHFDALGSVNMSRGKTSVTGRHVVADLWPGEGGIATNPKHVEIRGSARMRDPRNQVRIYGDAIVADFSNDGRLVDARVRGAEGRFASVASFPYRIRGHEIVIDQNQLTLAVDGPNALDFRATRGLQGQVLGSDDRISVSSTKSLRIDGQSGANTIRFDGDVVAKTSEEKLMADVMTLYLRDLPPRSEFAPIAGAVPGWARGDHGLELLAMLTSSEFYGRIEREAVRSISQARGGRNAKRDDGGIERVVLPAKEPLKIVAENATIETLGTALSGASGSLSALRIDVDIPGRRIQTRGETTLGLVSRRGAEELTGASEALGAPSALVSRGPNQTAIRCTHGLTYVIGENGSGTAPRRDSALFDGMVRFSHRAGKDVARPEEMIPKGADVKWLEKFPGRKVWLESDRLECEFIADDASRRGATAIAGAPLQLATMIAAGNVYLEDVQGTEKRQMNAGRLEFDRERNMIRILGADVDGTRLDARIYTENAATRQIGGPFTSPELIVDLRDNTIRTGELKGQIRR